MLGGEETQKLVQKIVRVADRYDCNQGKKPEEIGEKLGLCACCARHVNHWLTEYALNAAGRNKCPDCTSQPPINSKRPRPNLVQLTPHALANGRGLSSVECLPFALIEMSVHAFMRNRNPSAISLRIE